MHLLCKVWITLLKTSGGQGSALSYCKIRGSSPIPPSPYTGGAAIQSEYNNKVRTKIGELQIFTKLLVKF